MEGVRDTYGNALVYNIDTSWDTDSITYNHVPEDATGELIASNVGPFNEYVELDVTSMVTSLSHYGFSIRGTERNTLTGRYFQSMEGTNKPELVIEYDLVTPARGVSVVQTDNLVEWTVEEELDVKEYHVINAETKEVHEVVLAVEADTYSVELPDGVKAQIVVVDHNDATQTFVPDDGNQVSVEYELREGWNLIATVGEDSDFSELKKVVIGSLWTWDGQKYVAGGYSQAHAGVWAYSKNSQNVTVHADKANATETLTSGWNLVGPSNNVAVPDNVKAIYSYGSKYESILGNYDLLYKGIGYWFFVIEDTEIMLDVQK